jgi:hypothetical protein
MFTKGNENTVSSGNEAPEKEYGNQRSQCTIVGRDHSFLFGLSSLIRHIFSLSVEIKHFMDCINIFLR